MGAGAKEGRESAGPDVDQLMERLADRLGKGARAAAVFGEPVERDGVTVIPVAKARWGLGAGVGNDGGEDTGAGAATGEAGEASNRRRRGWGGRGVGGGGGAMVVPAGYIEIKGGASTYKPIVDAQTVAIVGTVATAAVLIVWGIAVALSR